MILNSQQREAVERAVEWYFVDSDTKNIFMLCGLAGSGKTSIAKIITDIIGLAKYNILYSCFTGKAVNVLRRKGNLANTIHRTFYNIYKSSDGTIRFSLKSKLPSVIKLIVLDEVSMINAKLMEDILSFGIPIICLGDPGQLQPIYGSNPYMENPDVFLTEVMRQDDTSGILDLAFMARNNESIPYGSYKNSKVVKSNEIKKYSDYDVVLCWKNSTRQELNHIIRKELKLTSTYPIKGEKLICLKNSYKFELDYEDIPVFIVNGLTCIATEDFKRDKDENLILQYKPDFINEDNYTFETKCMDEMFTSYIDPDVPSPLFHDLPEDITILDYGYALTVHKSQGSEWNNVLVINEFAGGDDTYNKWLYTAITRAKKSVTISSV